MVEAAMEEGIYRVSTALRSHPTRFLDVLVVGQYSYQQLEDSPQR